MIIADEKMREFTEDIVKCFAVGNNKGWSELIIDENRLKNVIREHVESEDNELSYSKLI